MKAKKIIAISAPVAVEAAAADAATNTPAKFSSTFYTGGAVEVGFYDHPVVVDLAGLTNGKVLVANLDHDSSKRVGNFDVDNDGRQLVAHGTAYPDAFEAAKEVVAAGRNGYQWQSSLEVQPKSIEFVNKGKSVTVNGQKLTGPLYVAREGILKGFAFVSHGADDNTTATIAASAARHKEKVMKPEIEAWAKDVLLLDVDSLTDEQKSAIEANYNGGTAKPAKIQASNPFEARKIDAKRRKDIREIADRMIEMRESDEDEIAAIEKMCDHAIEAKMSAQEFKLELYESTVPAGRTVRAPQRHDRNLTKDVLVAAICQAGRLQGHEELFDDRTLQAAYDQFRDGIGLKQLFLVAAEHNGHRTNHSGSVTRDVLRAAFPKQSDRPIHAQGFSTIDISDIVSNVANKFLRVGWNAVDMTPLRIANIRPVRDYKQITTVSLTGDLMFDKLGPGGEIKHGTLGEVTYNNQADLYARMLAITEKDIVNDDLGALTTVPQRLGRGAALKLNDVFWTVFLNNSTFFTSGNSNVNEAVADMSIGGLAATETVFMNQTDPDGKPLGVMPKIILVPTALKAAAVALMDDQSKLITGASATLSDVNVFRGRFRVESSPYMSNSSYTGYSAAAWYMLADPSELPVVEIVALNGRVEPIVESADADFNTLGVQMRGKSSIGVALQEKRGGVRADGGQS